MPPKLKIVAPAEQYSYDGPRFEKERAAFEVEIADFVKSGEFMTEIGDICPRCGKKSLITRQEQTRSLDEESTTIKSCKLCNYSRTE